MTKRYYLFLALKALANHLPFSSSSIFLRSGYYHDLHSLLYPTDYRSWSAGSFCLTFILTALVIIPWGLLVQTQKIGELIFPFALSVAYHITCMYKKVWKLTECPTNFLKEVGQIWLIDFKNFFSIVEFPGVSQRKVEEKVTNRSSFLLLIKWKKLTGGYKTSNSG